MAFFRNFSDGMDSRNDLNENSEDCNVRGVHNLVENEDTDASSSGYEKDSELKMDDHLRSEDEQVDGGGRVQNETASISRTTQNNHPSGRRAAVVGKWGSSFWKDCQPMGRQEGFDPAQDLKYMDSNGNNDEGSEDNCVDNKEDRVDTEGYDEQTEGEEDQSGQAEVPAEEMLSDDYYEQDVEEQSDSLHYRGLNRSTASSSKQPSAPMSVNKNMIRGTKAVNVKEYDDEDDDYEDDDEEEEDGDDPDDEDFEPDFGGTDSCSRKKDQEWDCDGSDDDDNDDDLDILDDDDMDYNRKSQRKGRSKGGRSLKPRENKPASTQTRQRKAKTFWEDEDSSSKDSENESDADFGSRARGARYVRKDNVGRATMATNIKEQNGDVRSSTRSTRKISYVESEESEEIEEEKAKKSQKEDIEEEDVDCIERVLWHQPKGMAEDALRNNKSAQPAVLSHLLDSDPDWNEIEFYIKWKGQSYLHCNWKSFSDLQNMTGYKKVLNYTKRVMEERRFRRTLSREEVEVHDVSKEMELDLIKQYSQVERIFADRISKSGSEDVIPEYLVKWKGLSYAEATWEKELDIAFAQDLIAEYKAREDAMTVQGKLVDFQRKRSKDSLRKLDEQPEWLKGGNLRDYQLEGLNFLVNSWRNDTNVILADEMGLGKTVQSVSMLGFLQNAQQIHGPFLVVVPLSTLTNWAKEFRKWLPEMNVVVYIGNRASREVSLFI